MALIAAQSIAELQRLADNAHRKQRLRVRYYEIGLWGAGGEKITVILQTTGLVVTGVWKCSAVLFISIGL